MSLQSVFDALRVKRTELIGSAKNVIAAYARADNDGDNDTVTETDESAPFEWWQHYGFISRPTEDTESLVARVGANVFAFASRSIAAAKAFGALSPGDVALYSVGGALLKLAANGTITLLVPVRGKQTVVNVSSKDGSIKGIVPPGLAFEISEKNGITLNAGNKDVTIAGKSVQLVGNTCNINTGSVKLGLTGSRPLGWTVGSSVAAVTVPVPNIFV